jgi:uncharacterized protein YifE (UPF0438 family)
MKWYKMDCDTQDNLDMRKLVADWGWDWYGRYCAIVGKVGMLVTEKRQTFALQTNNDEPFPVRLLANDLSTTVERLNNFCKYLADNRLIDKEAWYTKNLIYIPKLRERADEYTKKLLTKSRQCQEQEVEVEEEVDKEEDKRDTVRRDDKPTEQDFEKLWAQYPNRQGKKNALRHFLATVKTKDDLARITIALGKYLNSYNIGRGFIKNGSTWFNDWESWVNPTSAMMTGKRSDGEMRDHAKVLPRRELVLECQLCHKDIPESQHAAHEKKCKGE